MRLVIASLFLAAGVSGLSLVSGCDMLPGQTCACTADFRFFILNVVDQTSQPVTGVTITVTLVRTGQVLPVIQDSGMPGVYFALDDSFVQLFSTAADSVRVSGQKGASSFAADFVFDTDTCRCHLNKVSGPETATLTP